MLGLFDIFIRVLLFIYNLWSESVFNERSVSINPDLSNAIRLNCSNDIDFLVIAFNADIFVNTGITVENIKDIDFYSF